MANSIRYSHFLRTGFKVIPALFFLSLPVMAQNAAPQDLTLREALRAAYINNPAINSARSDLLAVQEELPQAQAGWKPSVTADADMTHTSSSSGGDDGTSKSADLSLTQPVYRGGRTVAQSAAARYTIEARSELLRAQEQDLFTAAVTAYMDVLRDDAVLELRRQNSDLLSRQLKATSDRFEVGELTKTDVSQSQARLAGAEADVTDAQGNLNSSRAVFEQIIGMPPGKLAPVDIDLSLPGTLDDAALRAEEGNPLVLAALNTHKASEKDVANIYGELLPEVGFFTGVGRVFDPPTGVSDRTDSTIGLEASVPLYEAGAVRSRVRQAKHAANSRYLDILDTKRQAREDAVRNWESLQAAKAQIKSREAQVEASSVAQQGVRQEAEFGARSILDALDADQELLDAQVALVVARRDEIVAQFALLATLGLLTPETLGFGGDAVHLDGHLEKIQHKIFDMDVDRVGNPG